MKLKLENRVNFIWHLDKDKQTTLKTPSTSDRNLNSQYIIILVEYKSLHFRPRYVASSLSTSIIQTSQEIMFNFAEGGFTTFLTLKYKEFLRNKYFDHKFFLYKLLFGNVGKRELTYH